MNIQEIRSHFPILQKQVNGKPLIYLDNASTTHKPEQILGVIAGMYMEYNANVHRGIYTLAEDATKLYENAREIVAQFINAQDPSEIVFTRNTTESINCVAASWAMHHIKEGDEIVLSELEHHSNLLPWQQIAHKNKAVLKYIPVNADGTLDISNLSSIITTKTKLVAVTQVSHALGTHVDLQPILQAARAVGAAVLIDAAQSAPHQRLDLQAMNVDFLAFSGHKMLGPNGIGVLYINKRRHDQLKPFQVGGGMVYEADYHTATWRPMPQLLEAGTPAIADAVGLAGAVEYLEQNVDFKELAAHEARLTKAVIDAFAASGRIKLLGPLDQLKEKGHLISFIVDGMHPHDVAAYLDTFGICVRAGHHCAQPLAKKMGLDASVRASFYCYNTVDEVEQLIGALKKL